MLSRLFLQMETAWPAARPLLIVAVCGVLVFLSGQFLIRQFDRRQRHVVKPKTGPNAAEDAQDRLKIAVRGMPVPVLVTDVDAAVRPVAAYVIGRSVEGLILELDVEGHVDPGTQLKVRPANANEMIPWVLVVVHDRQTLRSAWRLVCRYDRTPPFSVRMLFG